MTSERVPALIDLMCLWANELNLGKFWIAAANEEWPRLEAERCSMPGTTIGWVRKSQSYWMCRRAHVHRPEDPEFFATVEECMRNAIEWQK